MVLKNIGKPTLFIIKNTFIIMLMGKKMEDKNITMEQKVDKFFWIVKNITSMEY